MTDAEWTRKQHEFVEKRDAVRAQVCRCGRTRGEHMEDVGCCRASGCHSFRAQEAA